MWVWTRALRPPRPSKQRNKELKAFHHDTLSATLTGCRGFVQNMTALSALAASNAFGTEIAYSESCPKQDQRNHNYCNNHVC